MIRHLKVVMMMVVLMFQIVVIRLSLFRFFVALARALPFGEPSHVIFYSSFFLLLRFGALFIFKKVVDICLKFVAHLALQFIFKHASPLCGLVIVVHLRNNSSQINRLMITSSYHIRQSGPKCTDVVIVAFALVSYVVVLQIKMTIDNIRLILGSY